MRVTFAKVVWILIAVALPVTVSLAQETATPEPGMYVNPVLDWDFPDPDVLKVEETYYAYATNSGETNIQMARSADLVNWESLGEALPLLPDWAVGDFGWTWAPEVTTYDAGERFVMYFTTRYAIGDGGTQCIGVAVADNPEGPFEPVGDAPFICQVDEGGSIDPSSFTDDDGTRYVLWKNDGNSGGGQTWLYIQSVSEDGLTLEGEPTRLITADQPWEGILVEAPTLWKDEDRYYLFYSANDYASAYYTIGYAVADDILGPYEKPQRTPFLESSFRGGVVGPGGQDVVVAPNGDTWLVYHGWAADGRNLRITPLRWEDGVPVVDEPTREPRPAPR